MEPRNVNQAVESSLPRLRCYLDFDGTLTGIAGGNLVNSAFYRNLQKNYGEDYVTAKFKSGMPDILEHVLGDPLLKLVAEQIRVSPAAITFLKDMLTQGADIHIISKNRSEYIQAVMKVCGLSDDEVSRMLIHDTNDMGRMPIGGKGSVVRQVESRGPAEVTLVCDDSPEDLKLMVEAVSSKGRMSYIAKPGEFSWEKITSDVKLAMAHADSQPLETNATAVVGSVGLFTPHKTAQQQEQESRAKAFLQQQFSQLNWDPTHNHDCTMAMPNDYALGWQQALQTATKDENGEFFKVLDAGEDRYRVSVDLQKLGVHLILQERALEMKALIEKEFPMIEWADTGGYQLVSGRMKSSQAMEMAKETARQIQKLVGFAGAAKEFDTGAGKHAAWYKESHESKDAYVVVLNLQNLYIQYHQTQTPSQAKTP